MGYLEFSLLSAKDYNVYNTMRTNAWNIFSQLQDNKQLCDMVIMCQGQQFYVHRCIMAAVSPYFKAVVVSNFKHCMETGKLKTDLSNFSPACVEMFVDLIYQKSTLKVSEFECLELWKLLDFVQIKYFDQILMYFILGNLTVENCWTYLDIGDPYVVDNLERYIISFITLNIYDCLTTSSFRNASKTAILKCLRSYEVFHALPSHAILDFILKWVNVDLHVRQKECAEILYYLQQSWACDMRGSSSVNLPEANQRD